jgi:ABC-type uncharacterized transport system involved in gliding motility auxiliary subunit
MQTVIFAILGLVSMLVGLLMSLILPQTGVLAWGLIALGIILVTAAFVMDFRRVKGAVTSRRGKYGTSTSVMMIFVNSISVGVNHQFDLTALSSFTLTAQTKDVLAKLDKNINVYCFFLPTDDTSHTEAYALNVLAQYQNYTKDLTLSIIDPDQHPEQARKYGITDSSLYESIVFETDIGTYTVYPTQIIDTTNNTFYAENSFTNAILEVTGTQEKKIYFVTGEGEATPSDLSDAANALQNSLLQIMVINLQVATSIPDDCAVLLVAGPTQSMTESERQLIKTYLLNNGKAIFMTNPNSPDDIAKLLAPYGIGIPGGTLIDPSSYVIPSMDTLNVQKANDYLGLANVYFPGATAITQSTLPSGLGWLTLVSTSTDSWLDLNFDPSVTPKYDSATETKGTYTIGALIAPQEITDSSGNGTGKTYAGPSIVVFGDSDFITNSNFYSVNNGDLFLNLVKYLGAGDVVQIENRGLTNRRLIISPEEASFLNISSIALLPAIVLIIGILMWWRRK